MKKVLSIILAIVTIVTTIMCVSFSSSATAFPSFSKKIPLKTYTISTGNNTTTYTNNSLSSKKGTIYASDEIYIYSIGKNSKNKYYAFCSYPVSSGRKEAYIPLSAVTSATSASAVNTAQTTATTYRRASTSSKLGSIAKNDKIYKVAVSGSYTQVIYNVGSANSPTAWKMGWVKTADYNKLIKSTTTKSTTKATTKVSTTVAKTTVQKKLDGVIAKYPNKSRFLSTFDGAKECYGFGKKVIYEVFGKNKNGGYRSWTYAGVSTSGMKTIGSITSFSSSNVKNLLSKAKPGDVLQFNTPKQHTMIVYSVDSTGVKIYDCNWDNNCGIRLVHLSFGTWSGRNSSKLTLLRSDNY
ncbi:MAG: hypothetical protein MJ147_08870 [Clostridia bacterium]|nr:hypothetical protein [Clostridia bacterium]